MTRYEKDNWLCSIRDSENAVIEGLGQDFGQEVVNFIYNKYGASSIEDLSPSCYSDVFSELYFYEADLKD